MKYFFLYMLCMFLFMVTFTLTAHAQQKVPDMSRFSKAPLSTGGNSGTGSARIGAKTITGSGARTSRESFTRASVKPGGGTKAGVPGTTAGTAENVTNVELPSSIKPSAEPAVKKTTIPAIPEAVKEQLNMKPEPAPAKTAGKKLPAKS